MERTLFIWRSIVRARLLSLTEELLIMSFNRSMNLTFNERREIVAGYERMVLDHVRSGKRPYFINFMFRALPGNEETKRAIMIKEVGRVHDLLSRHMVRKPDSEAWRDVVPIFVGTVDLPVPKNIPKLVLLPEHNGGKHPNVIALLPPHQNEKVKRRFTGLRRSRLSVDLATHFEECKRFYLNDRLERIHVTPMTYGNMTDYALKAFKTGRMNMDDLIVL
jgi:hypothetical protein